MKKSHVRAHAPDDHAAGATMRASPDARPAAFAAPRGRIYGSIIETIGGTPMVALPRLGRGTGCSPTWH